ncbi:hypothetical protein H9L21_04800 [Aeromicrobium senzhongii]|uniref:YCII-related domain-containing protein n=1 Tax=Aeromicrobium senzhongii TaxID=2663859 RepID=A0ABX6SYD3_9ACTN|nr:YciI family protein [Aeromicrobium senzhongii]MTB87713.1 hypothetical protein [Aeromicrobium senzhongii]QNL95255.1 hypothetical protein H9L21_04800 [Aeromicrobium senzhongii]
MSKFLISFAEGAMDIPEEEIPAVVAAAHAAVEQARAADAWVLGGGLMHHELSTVVYPDGTVADGPDPQRHSHLAGLGVVDVESLEDALEWAATFAAACRCVLEVREFIPDPES